MTDLSSYVSSCSVVQVVLWVIRRLYQRVCECECVDWILGPVNYAEKSNAVAVVVMLNIKGDLDRKR